MGTGNRVSSDARTPSWPPAADCHIPAPAPSALILLFHHLPRPITHQKAWRFSLTKLKELLVLNWRQKATARSQLKLAIEDTLDSRLPHAYTRELYQQKCSAVFEHFYESYPERNVGVYAASS